METLIVALAASHSAYASAWVSTALNTGPLRFLLKVRPMQRSSLAALPLR